MDCTASLVDTAVKAMPRGMKPTVLAEINICSALRKLPQATSRSGPAALSCRI